MVEACWEVRKGREQQRMEKFVVVRSIVAK